MILLRRIQATAARAQSVTPPHPRSMLHAVVNLLALRTLRRTGIPITPSSGPSTGGLVSGRSCTLLKCMIVNVNSANVAVTERDNFLCLNTATWLDFWLIDLLAVSLTHRKRVFYSSFYLRGDTSLLWRARLISDACTIRKSLWARHILEWLGTPESKRYSDFASLKTECKSSFWFL